MSIKKEVAIKIYHLKKNYPHFYKFIDTGRSQHTEYIKLLQLIGYSDFEKNENGGRGETYNRAQVDPTVRISGILKLVQFLLPDNKENFTPNNVLLDVLGGDGVIARALKQTLPYRKRPRIIVGDVARQMIDAALRHKLPAVLQPAEYLIIKDNCVDGVIMAYGTHHINVNYRQQAVLEAYRVLKPGGKLVMHDFEENSPVAKWFSQVVDVYSTTGHHYKHFTRDEMLNLVNTAGFTNTEIHQVYDPFILFGKTKEECEEKLSDYLINMYGLAKLRDKFGEDGAKKKVLELALHYFNYDTKNLPEKNAKKTVSLEKIKSGWRIEMPRVVLVAVGTKPI